METRLILQAILKSIKYFPLVLLATIVGLAVLAVEERREENEKA